MAGVFDKYFGGTMKNQSVVNSMHQIYHRDASNLIDFPVLFRGKKKFIRDDNFNTLKSIFKTDLFFFLFICIFSFIPSPFGEVALFLILSLFCIYGFLRLKLARSTNNLRKRANHRVYQAILVVIFSLSFFVIISFLDKSIHDYYNVRFLLSFFAIVPIFTLLLVFRAFVFQVKSGHQKVVLLCSDKVSQSFIFKLKDELGSSSRLESVYYINFMTSSLMMSEDISKFYHDVKYNKVNEVYIIAALEEQASLAGIVEQLSDSTANVYLISETLIEGILNRSNSILDSRYCTCIYGAPLSLLDRSVKRLFDVVFSVVALIFLAIPMLLISLAIKINSKGPVIFRQRRYGRDGDIIEVWKFRSMTTMDNGSTIKQATKNDARITSVGAFLRRTSLDELPQFINVLQGRMSVVGPRPHAVAHNEEYRKLIKGYMLRHKVKPGITGWAQIHGWRGETDTLEKMSKRVEFDLAYVYGWSIIMDIKIALLTPIKGFINKNAY